MRAHSATEGRVRGYLTDRHSRTFAASFPALAAQHPLPPDPPPFDTLAAAYTCQVLSGGRPCAGDLFLTNRHLCFAQHAPGGVAGSLGLLGAAPPFRVFMQWDDVLSVRPTLALRTDASEGDDRPFIHPLPSPLVRPSCVQVFTRAGTIVELLGFGGIGTSAAEQLTFSCPGDALERCYKFIDALWRAAAAAAARTIPDPGVDWGGGAVENHAPAPAAAAAPAPGGAADAAAPAAAAPASDITVDLDSPVEAPAAAPSQAGAAHVDPAPLPVAEAQE